MQWQISQLCFFFILPTLVLVMTRWQIQTSKQSKHVRYLGQSTEQMKNRLEVIPYNPMIAHPTQIFQATREARLISEDVETPSVEDEGLGAEEVLNVTSTKFTNNLFMKRVFCHKMMFSSLSLFKQQQDTSESEKTELKTLRSLFDQAKLDNRWRISQLFIFLF